MRADVWEVLAALAVAVGLAGIVAWAVMEDRDR